MTQENDGAKSHRFITPVFHIAKFWNLLYYIYIIIKETHSVMEELKCPICGDPTSVYMGNARKDRLCRKHAKEFKDGLIYLCEKCGRYHAKDTICPESIQEEIYTELPYNGFDKCIQCGKETYGYAFCSECYYKKSNEELLKDLNQYIKKSNKKQFNKIEIKTEKEQQELLFCIDTEVQKQNKKCLLCDNDSGEYMFCRTCFSQYRNKTLLLKVTIDNNQKIELLNESYEGIYVCKDGHVVKSKSERDIDNYLFEHKIAHAYEKALPINGEIFKPDFYLPDLDVYIEHWGYDETNIEYTRRKEYKITKYIEKGITLICTYEATDMKDVETSLEIKLDTYKKGEINFL